MKTRLFKYIVNIWALAFFTGFYSCSKDDESEPYIPIDEITVSIAELVPDKDTKAVSTTLTFKNIGEIDYLLITKSGGESYSAKIEKPELSASYPFRYMVKKNRSRIFSAIIDCLLQGWK